MQQTESATIPVKGDIDLRHVRSRSCRNCGHCSVDLGVTFDVEGREAFLFGSNAATDLPVA
jgi:hypothetical protein